MAWGAAASVPEDCWQCDKDRGGKGGGRTHAAVCLMLERESKRFILSLCKTCVLCLQDDSGM